MKNNELDIVMKYNELLDNMLYDIFKNLRNNKMTFEELADELGITTEELLVEFATDKKDFYVELESINYFEKNNKYVNYNELRKVKR